MIARFFIVAMIVCSAVASAKELPVEYFAKLPAFSDPQISPSGKHLATTLIAEGKPLLIIQDFSSGKEKKYAPVAIPFDGVHIHWYRWASDERLIVASRLTVKDYNEFGNALRLLSVSRDGKDIKYLKVGTNKWGYHLPNPHIVSWLVDDPDHVLAVLERSIDNKKALVDLRSDQNHYLLHKVNVHTGEKTLFDANRKGFHRWIADKQGNVRIGVKYHSGTRGLISTFYRETPDAPWRVLQKLKILDHERLEPLFFDEDDHNILVVTSDDLEDEDYSEEDDDLYKYDLTKGEIVGPYEDPVYMPIKRGIEKAMPGMKVRLASKTQAKDQFIIRIYSDTKAPDYYYYQRKEKHLSYLASEYPQLNDVTLAKMQEVSYQARDGLKIPAFLTIPVGAEEKNLPLVVYPHGGPWARDTWGFENYVQLFANRGYAVLQPQFRGSTGFGIDHLEAGYKQWGYTIQDDITDGVKWLIEQGIADPKRICILGGSFGGYAAAMGLIRTPELYQCGVSINGVMDLNQWYHSLRFYHSVNREITNSKWSIEKASPFHLAGAIKAPLLLVVGEKDTVVPALHSEKMYKKLKRQKKSVSYVELPDGEHWRTDEKNEVKAMTAVDNFLKEHLSKKIH